MLPASVAAQLKAGMTVSPRMYKSATVLFIDICRFTDMCAQSTPVQIVTLLNALFTQFDATVAANDAYKVETIGDCYMVVTGVPRECVGHEVTMARVAVAMLDAVVRTHVAHMPDDYRLRMRAGVNSGALAAGVVGVHAPRYCLFGDTVCLPSLKVRIYEWVLGTGKHGVTHGKFGGADAHSTD
jgi:class 3 adenylate cyclase